MKGRKFKILKQYIGKNITYACGKGNEVIVSVLFDKETEEWTYMKQFIIECYASGGKTND